MANRYFRINKIKNEQDLYQTVFQNKKINHLIQYETFRFGKLKTVVNSGIEYLNHTVDVGENLEKISKRYYNAPDYGWIILYTNSIGSELDLYIGQTLTIYYPLSQILSLLAS